MSGPIGTADAPATAAAPPAPAGPVLEISESRTAMVGRTRVRRALPRRVRRTVGAWCFADHLGPAATTADEGLDIGPHPHIGLQTVTWLLEGKLLHRDSLGSEQVVAPGQLNLMTAGGGIVHAEETTGTWVGRLHGIQLWIALPERTRHGGGAFAHHGALPQTEHAGGVATVLIGDFAGAASPARHDTPLVGVDLALHRGRTAWPLQPAFEYAVVVLAGAVVVDGQRVVPGELTYLGLGRTEVVLDASADTDAPTRLVLLGGEPFEAPVVMWWNFVGRTRAEIAAAYQDWAQGTDRFGRTSSPLARIPVEPPAWVTDPTT